MSNLRIKYKFIGDENIENKIPAKLNNLKYIIIIIM